MSFEALRRNDLVSHFLQEGANRLTKIFDWRVHLCHTHYIRDGTFCSDDTTKCVGIFFTELLKQHQSKFVEELVLTALLDDDRKARSKVGGLLADFGTLVVETPEDRGNDLGKVRLDANT